MLADSHLYRYLSSRYTWAELEEAGFTKEELIHACELQQHSNGVGDEKGAVVPKRVLRREDFSPIEKFRMKSVMARTSQQVRVTFRRPPAEDDKKLAKASSPEMGEIEFEFVSSDSTVEASDKLRYAQILIGMFEKELQGRGYSTIEGGVEVKLLESCAPKLRFHPGVRVKCDARFFPDIEFMIRQMASSAMESFKIEKSYQATGNLPLPTSQWERTFDEGVNKNLHILPETSSAAELAENKLPGFDKFSQHLLASIDKRVRVVRYEKDRGTFKHASTATFKDL